MVTSGTCHTMPTATFAMSRRMLRLTLNDGSRASTFLRAHSLHLVNATMRELKAERYSVEQILRIVVERADKLGVWVRGSKRDALRHARWMLVYLTRLYAQGESPRLSL
jgi:hypothetical protein